MNSNFLFVSCVAELCEICPSGYTCSQLATTTARCTMASGSAARKNYKSH